MEPVKNNRGKYRIRDKVAAAPVEQPARSDAVRSYDEVVRCFNHGTTNGYTNWNWPLPPNKG